MFRLTRVAVLFALLPLASTDAQTCPATPTEANRGLMFKKGADVTIAVSPLSAADPIRNCMSSLTQTASAWERSSAGVLFGVTLRFTTDFSNATVRIYAEAPPPDPATNKAPPAAIKPWPDPYPEPGNPGLLDATLRMNPANLGNGCRDIQALFAHELGHTFGLQDCYTCTGTVMQGLNSTAPLGPTSCDNTKINQTWKPALDGEIDPNAKPEPPPPGGVLDPVIIDVAGNGIRLTSPTDGVSIDYLFTGVPSRVAWTEPGSDDAWLVLDRDGDGAIDYLREMFGDRMRQPPSANPNGYRALALYDLVANGGNGDGRLDPNDAVWPQLRAWQDRDHDGVSSAEELLTLDGAGITALEFEFKEARRHDVHGNVFRYRAKAEGASRGAARWTHDVLLRVE